VRNPLYGHETGAGLSVTEAGTWPLRPALLLKSSLRDLPREAKHDGKLPDKRLWLT